MAKILSVKQIREWDQYTIKNEPIESIDLMERACKAFSSWYTERFGPELTVGIVCGTGNNGGDGLGIARMLYDWGYQVAVWVVKGDVSLSQDFKTNLERLQLKVIIQEIVSAPDAILFNNCDVLIDAIFGSGLSRPVEGIYAQTIDQINISPVLKISIDIPSGLLADEHSLGSIINADFTVSFQQPKLAFFLPENVNYVGEWEVLDIGLSNDFIEKASANVFYFNRREIKQFLITRSKFSHKGDYGKAILIAGSNGKMGAAILAARAALRSGVGLLTVHVPHSGYPIIQTAVPEAMASVDEEDFFCHSPFHESYNTIGIGPGLGLRTETMNAFLQTLEKATRPMVIDADGLNILSSNKDWLTKVPPFSILTPHPKEFERLVGSWHHDFEKLDKLRELSKKYSLHVVVKGANTVISSPDGNLFFNSTGNPGMATGGSGDVLTGILTGLLAQNYTPLNSAILGVFLHGLAGDLAVKDLGKESLIASDIVEYLPHAFKKLRQ